MRYGSSAWRGPLHAVFSPLRPPALLAPVRRPAGVHQPPASSPAPSAFACSLLPRKVGGRVNWSTTKSAQRYAQSVSSWQLAANRVFSRYALCAVRFALMGLIVVDTGRGVRYP